MAPIVVESWLPRRASAVVTAIAAYYLTVLALSTSGVDFLERLLPTSLRFFTQLTSLFPEAAQVSIDYRIEGFRCTDGTWQEIDYGPYFPMRPGDKENRFQRLGHFYRSNAKVITALEDFILPRLPEKMGGIRMLSLRIPFPPVAEGIERYRSKPLIEYPTSFSREWYVTPERRRLWICANARRPADGMDSP